MYLSNPSVERIEYGHSKMPILRTPPESGRRRISDIPRLAQDNRGWTWTVLVYIYFLTNFNSSALL